MKKLCQRFYDEAARIEEMVLLAGVLADESLPDTVRDFFEDEEFETIEECFGKLPEHVKEDLEAGDKEALPAWLMDSGKYGFLLKVATPIMTPTGKNSASYSWGYYTTKWVYGDTLDVALEAGFAFVAGQRKKEKAKAKKKA